MKKKLYSIAFLLISFNCFSQGNRFNQPSFESKDTVLYGSQLIYPFSDKSYILNVKVLNKEPNNEAEKNIRLTFKHFFDGKEKLIFETDLYSMHQYIEFEDFNNDKVKDILIFYYTGARANPTYNLYLRDKSHRRLIYIKGFERLPNPHLEAGNIIVSQALYGGTIYYEFHRINNQNKLINLGHSLECGANDDDKYQKAIKAILNTKGIYK